MALFEVVSHRHERNCKNLSTGWCTKLVETSLIRLLRSVVIVMSHTLMLLVGCLMLHRMHAHAAVVHRHFLRLCYQEPPDIIATGADALNRYKRPLYYITEDTTKTTSALCKQMAREPGYAYAVVQYGGQCYAGDDVSKYTTKGVCDTTCTGNINQTCGGGWTNAIYTAQVRAHALAARNQLQPGSMLHCDGHCCTVPKGV